MIMNGKNYSEEIKNLLTQNSKNIDERFFGNNSFSLVSLRNGNIQGFSAYFKISNNLCEIFLYIPPELIDQPEEIKLFEKLISIAKRNRKENLSSTGSRYRRACSLPVFIIFGIKEI